jgi:hypothetical protein
MMGNEITNMAKAIKEPWTKTTFDTPVNGKMTAKERAARKQFVTAIEHAAAQYHQAGGSIRGIEMYPTK